MSSVKRENNTVVLSGTTIILDIEGTTSSISFVKDVLFPYVQKHLEDYVKRNWDTAEFKEIVKALKAQALEDEENKIEGVVAIPESEEKDDLVKTVINNVLWQMKNDRKTKCLKDLQGFIMEEGYKQGDLKGHVYDDVEPNLKSWTELNKSIYIYSSGSVHAQKLLFGHSVKGDLLPFIKGHFDTTVGMKSETESYKKILEEMSCSPSDAAFLTDVPKEARAAKKVGIKAILLAREGNAPLTEEDIGEFPVITSFEEVEFEHNSKKRKICIEAHVTSDNKSVETCVVSIDKKLDPNDPKLTINGDVEMMEVEESTKDETVIKEDKHETKSKATEINDKQENNCDKASKLEENKEVEVVNSSSDVKTESREKEAEPVCKDEADIISGEQDKSVSNEKEEDGIKNDLASVDKAFDGKEEKDEENNKTNEVSVVVEKISESADEEKKETGVQVKGELNQTNGVPSVVEEKGTDTTGNGNEETDVKLNSENSETNKSPSVVEKDSESIEADTKPKQSDSQTMEKDEEEIVEKETVSIEEVKNVECDNSTSTSSHKVKDNEPEENQTDITESKVDSTVDSTEDSTKSITPSSKPSESIDENATSEAEVKNEVSTNSTDSGVKENGCVDSSELTETKSLLEKTSPSKNKSDEKITIPKESDKIKEKTNDPQSKSTLEISNDNSTEECTSNCQNSSATEAAPEQCVDSLTEKAKECVDSMEVDTHSQVSELKCDSSSDEKSSIKDAAMDVSESAPAELASTETEVSDPQITSLSEDVMETESQTKQPEENNGVQQNGHVENDKAKPENIKDAQVKDSSDAQPDTNDSKESSKTESSGTSQEAERNGKTPENTEVDISITKEIKVPSIEKTEVNNEEKCQSNGTNHSEISQNGKMSNPGLDGAVETVVEA